MNKQPVIKPIEVIYKPKNDQEAMKRFRVRSKKLGQIVNRVNTENGQILIDQVLPRQEHSGVTIFTEAPEESLDDKVD